MNNSFINIALILVLFTGLLSSCQKESLNDLATPTIENTNFKKDYESKITMDDINYMKDYELESFCCVIYNMEVNRYPNGTYKAIADISANEGDRVVFEIDGVLLSWLIVNDSCAEGQAFLSSTFSFNGCENLTVTVKVIHKGQVCSSKTLITALC